MVTKKQAMLCQEFHQGKCTKFQGPRGGTAMLQIRWYANGSCQTWVRSPERFRLPVKHGVYAFGYITEENQRMFHTV